MRKVLIVHVPYEVRGGEDAHVESLVQAYDLIGVKAVRFPSPSAGFHVSASQALRSLMPGSILPELETFCDRESPDFIHLHNAFPLLGPKFFRWLIAIGSRMPAIMTVHNHRFYCTNGLALRDGRICKDCLHAVVPWRPMLHNCNGDFAKTTYHAAAIFEMRAQRLYERAMRKFIAPSPYIKTELIRFGIPTDQIVQLGHPIADPVPIREVASEWDVLYAGRLSVEKGIRNLVKCAALRPQYLFAVTGDGPERVWLENQTREFKNLHYAGRASRAEVITMIRKSQVTLMPSLCNESFGLFAFESFFQGKRCVVPDLESTRWLSGPDYPGIGARMEDPEQICSVLDEAIRMAPSDRYNYAALRDRVGVAEFSRRLNMIISEFSP